MIDILLDYGADITQPDKDGTPSYYYAASSSEFTTLKHLLKHKSAARFLDLIFNTLLSGISEKKFDINIIKYIIEQGANINSPGYQNDVGEFQVLPSPLILAASLGNPNIINYLLANGADVDIKEYFHSMRL